MFFEVLQFFILLLKILFFCSSKGNCHVAQKYSNSYESTERVFIWFL